MLHHRKSLPASAIAEFASPVARRSDMDGRHRMSSGASTSVGTPPPRHSGQGTPRQSSNGRTSGTSPPRASEGTRNQVVARILSRKFSATEDLGMFKSPPTVTKRHPSLLDTLEDERYSGNRGDRASSMPMGNRLAKAHSLAPLAPLLEEPGGPLFGDREFTGLERHHRQRMMENFSKFGRMTEPTAKVRSMDGMTACDVKDTNCGNALVFLSFPLNADSSLDLEKTDTQRTPGGSDGASSKGSGQRD